MTFVAKKNDSKELILSEASVLFWQKGYADTSMKDIAGACGFRPANIYNFFKNKEEILFEILFDEMNDIIKAFKEIERSENRDPIKKLAGLIGAHTRLTLSSRRTSVLLFDVGLGSLSMENREKIVSLRDEYDRIMAAAIQEGIDAGIFIPTDVKMALFCIASMITRTRIWFSDKGRLSLDEVTDYIIRFALNGLRGNVSLT